MQKLFPLLLLVFTQNIQCFAASPSPTPSETMDSIGCGDGVKSAPNGWMVSIQKKDPNIFLETAMLSVNLFRITGVTGDISFNHADMGMVDATKVPEIIYQVAFNVGVDTAAYPTSKEDSLKNRDEVLTKLKSLGATVTCNQIIPRGTHPIRRKTLKE